MKFAYKFSNLLGTVYHQGNLTFTPDGNTLLSPVGNRITRFDLKSNKAETLPCESELNFTAVAISPDGNLVIAANEEGEAMMISMRSQTIIYRYHFHRRVNAISFSPDGKKFLVTKEKTILMFHTPGKTRQFNPFELIRTFYGPTDNTVCIDWTTDSSAFCVGGEDKCTRVYGAQKYKNLIIYSLGSNTDSVVNAFFDNDSLDVYSVSRNGQVCVYECDTELNELIPDTTKTEKSEGGDEEDEKAEEKKEEKRQKSLTIKETDQQTEGKAIYKRTARHNFKSSRGEGVPMSYVTAAAYHKNSHILVTGFEDGSFFLHEMPEFNLIHSLSMESSDIASQGISSVTFNRSGDWIALGCSGVGQLMVWEWQSESNVLKQQGHFSNMECLDYSPDGQYIVSGGSDAKVKVWNTSSGFCFVTFSEHLSAVTGVKFTQNGKSVVSASLDGTVRAFDLIRYRNFRTLTSPRPAQFSCVAVDNGGEIVCAGGKDVFDIFVWNLSKGSLMEVLSGHEGPISCLAFATNHYILASGAWDKKLKLWDVFESRGAKETIMLPADAQAVAYRPDGDELAVATLDAQISFWNVHTAQQVGSVEGRHDLGYTRKEGDKITAKKSAMSKCFNTVTYSADGQCILAAGRSKNVCIYSVADQLLLKKFEITCNRSLDGTQEFLDRRQMTEWGSLALVDEGQGDAAGGKVISLPGVKKGDLSSRHWKPEVRVGQVRFSPTGRSWAATTTEGLLIYSLDQGLVWDPYELDVEVTPEQLHRCLKDGDHTTALILAFRLNEEKLIQEAVESIPVKDIPVICEQLADVYVDKLLAFISRQLESTQHVGFYLLWSKTLLFRHGAKLKGRAATLQPTTRALIKSITTRMEPLDKICEHNYHTINYLVNMPRGKKRKTVEDSDDDDEEEDMDAENYEEGKRMKEAEEEEEGGLQEVWESSDDEGLDLAKLMA